MKLLVGIVALLAVVVVLGCAGPAAKVTSGITNEEMSAISSDVGGIDAPLGDLPALEDIDVSGIDQAFT